MNNIIKQLTDVKYNIDITGKIFICDQLCDITYDYKEYDKLVIFNKGSYLEIDYQNPASRISYNGDDSTGSQYNDYYLKKILITSPPRHFINSVRNVNNLELLLIHQSFDEKRFQILTIPLEPTPETKSELSFKLFDKFANDVPNKTKGSSTIKNIDNWNPDDFFPENRSFYTYNSPFDDSINWIVYENAIPVPDDLKTNFDKYVLNTNKTLANILIGAKAPINPTNLVLFNHKFIKTISKKCANKIKNDLDAVCAKNGSGVGSSIEAKAGEAEKNASNYFSNFSANKTGASIEAKAGEAEKNVSNYFSNISANKTEESVSNYFTNAEKNITMDVKNNTSGNLLENLRIGGAISNIESKYKSKWWHWLLLAIGIAVILGVVGYILYTIFNSNSPNLTGDVGIGSGINSGSGSGSGNNGGIEMNVRNGTNGTFGNSAVNKAKNMAKQMANAAKRASGVLQGITSTPFNGITNANANAT